MIVASTFAAILMGPFLAILSSPTEVPYDPVVMPSYQVAPAVVCHKAETEIRLAVLGRAHAVPSYALGYEVAGRVVCPYHTVPP